MSAIEFCEIKNQIGSTDRKCRKSNASEEELTRKQDKIVNTKVKDTLNFNFGSELLIIQR
jgi:hypothetical protein